jgi:hypothetical protein
MEVWSPESMERIERAVLRTEQLSADDTQYRHKLFHDGDTESGLQFYLVTQDGGIDIGHSGDGVLCGVTQNESGDWQFLPSGSAVTLYNPKYPLATGIAESYGYGALVMVVSSGGKAVIWTGKNTKAEV